MLWRHIKAAWRYGKAVPYVVEADAETFWTNADAQATAHFFSSPTGKKLGMRLSNYAIKMAIAAVQNQNPATIQSVNGQAAGVGLTISAIELHHPQTEAEAEPETILDQMEAVA